MAVNAYRNARYEGRVLAVVPRGNFENTCPGYDARVKLRDKTRRESRILVIPLEDIPNYRAYRGMEFSVQLNLKPGTRKARHENLTAIISHKDPAAEHLYLGVLHKSNDRYAHLRIKYDATEKIRKSAWLKIPNDKVLGELVPSNQSEDEEDEAILPTHVFEQLKDGRFLIRPLHLPCKGWKVLLAQELLFRRIFRKLDKR
jgi:hypothetical protein